MRAFPAGPKSEWQHQADQIVRGEIATSEEDVPMLLEWLRDFSWPGAETIARHLPSYGDRVVSDALVEVLKSGDAIWIHWVLSSLSDAFDRVFWQLHDGSIRRIAGGKDLEGAAAEALYILARYELESLDSIRKMVAEAKAFPGTDAGDYSRVDALL